MSLTSEITTTINQFAEESGVFLDWPCCLSTQLLLPGTLKTKQQSRAELWTSGGPAGGVEGPWASAAAAAESCPEDHPGL